MTKIDLNKIDDAKSELRVCIRNLGLQHSLDVQIESLVEDGVYDDYEEGLSDTLEYLINSTLSKLY